MARAVGQQLRVCQLPMALLLALCSALPAFAFLQGHVLPSFNCDKIAFFKVRAPGSGRLLVCRSAKVQVFPRLRRGRAINK